MKKIIIAMFILFAGLGITNAQTAPAKTKVKATATVKATPATPATKTTKAIPATPAKPATPAATVKTKEAVKSTGTKKDGTPDMRMKENKDKAKIKVTGPTKKDGSADMRYKVNKKK